MQQRCSVNAELKYDTYCIKPFPLETLKVHTDSIICMAPRVFRITKLLCHCGKGVTIPRGCLLRPVNAGVGGETAE